MVEFQENFILTAKFMELRRGVEILQIFQEQNAIGNVATYYKSRTHYDILQNIPGTKRNTKCCRIFQEQNAIRNVAEYSKSRT